MVLSRRKAARLCAVSLSLLPLFQGAPSFAQEAASIMAPAGYAALQAPCSRQPDGRCLPVSVTQPLPVAPPQERLALVTANTPADPLMVFGGIYVVSQDCTGYGTLTVRYLGPDGAAMMPLLVRTAGDMAGGTLVTLASGAVVDAVLNGTTGCNASLARVP